MTAPALACACPTVPCEHVAAAAPVVRRRVALRRPGWATGETRGEDGDRTFVKLDRGITGWFPTAELVDECDHLGHPCGACGTLTSPDSDPGATPKETPDDPADRPPF